jgi:hypothetical protein
LPVSRVSLNSNQFIDPAELTRCRNDYIARNGTGSLCNDVVQNPFQPATGTLINFGAAPLRNRTMTRIQTLQPYPALSGSGLVMTNGWSTYNSLQTSVTRSFASGLQFNANYVWSKTLALESSEAQSNGFADGGFGYNGGLLDLRNLKENYGYASTDVPHRFVASFVYALPFGKGKRFNAGKIGNALAGGWQFGGTYVAQAGIPLVLSGLNNGALNGRMFRVPGVDLEVPKALQRWYDGNTTVTLPSGRNIRPCNRCFLKYNPDAFRGAFLPQRDAQGNHLKDAAGNLLYFADSFWNGTSAFSYGDLRQWGLNNFNLSLDRVFSVTEKVKFELSAQASNFLNRTQFRPSFNGGLGGTQVNAANGGIVGLGTNDNYGTHSMATFDPRQIEFHLRLRF